jgi:hypothetical protein
MVSGRISPRPKSWNACLGIAAENSRLVACQSSPHRDKPVGGGGNADDAPISEFPQAKTRRCQQNAVSPGCPRVPRVPFFPLRSVITTASRGCHYSTSFILLTGQHYGKHDKHAVEVIVGRSIPPVTFYRIVPFDRGTNNCLLDGSKRHFRAAAAGHNRQKHCGKHCSGMIHWHGGILMSWAACDRRKPTEFSFPPTGAR